MRMLSFLGDSLLSVTSLLILHNGFASSDFAELVYQLEGVTDDSWSIYTQKLDQGVYDSDASCNSCQQPRDLMTSSKVTKEPAIHIVPLSDKNQLQSEW